MFMRSAPFTSTVNQPLSFTLNWLYTQTACLRHSQQTQRYSINEKQASSGRPKEAEAEASGQERQTDVSSGLTAIQFQNQSGALGRRLPSCQHNITAFAVNNTSHPGSRASTR